MLDPSKYKYKCYMRYILVHMYYLQRHNKRFSSNATLLFCIIV